jgi:UPF0755 protein
MKRKTVRKLARYVFAPLGVFLLFAGIIYYRMMYAPNAFEGDRIITVSKGMSFKQVVDSLETYGVIRSRTLFELAGRVRNVSRGIHIGKYLFQSGVSNGEILENLRTGRGTMFVSITLPEGRKVTTYARILQRDLGIDSARFVEFAFDTSFVRSLDIDADALEGYLLPDTYLFSWQADEEYVIRRLVDQFWTFYSDSLQLRAEELRMTTGKVLTLASIVEGETTLDSERPIIAGVYHNRLKKRMRLQADPTIQYVLPDGPRRLWYKDLQIQSPYNTYQRYGLPPGPISNPGRASILAVLYPAQHSYLYFVADGAGGHIFSRSYSEHQRAVYRYRKVLRQRI